jgi:hypothetical protein
MGLASRNPATRPSNRRNSNDEEQTMKRPATVGVDLADHHGERRQPLARTGIADSGPVNSRRRGDRNAAPDLLACTGVAAGRRPDPVHDRA